ncbi:pilus assembly protein [Aeromicrobium halocynthiae]|uniref:Pilus assembly protein n=1 Tax=Aeromicrobium halocynthiae TaxID=560557 RepID=A0ABN2VWJ4_9ACTN
MIGNRRHRVRRRDEHGAAMVEFALIAPLFIALVFAVISYGYMLSYRQAVSQAASEGARSVAVAPSGTAQAQLASRARDAINGSLGSYGVQCATGGVLTRGGTTVGSCTITTSTSCGSGGGTCTTVVVDHAYRANPLIPSFPGLGITLPDRLRYSASMEVG